MRIETATQEDLATGLAPCAPEVLSVTTAEHLILQVTFADGIHGEVKFLHSHLTGVFNPLKNPEFFSQAAVQQGAVTWPGDLDLAPDAMYDAIKATGSWVLV